MGSRVDGERFVGSKGGAGVWQRIICWMPPHDVYIEPFAGRAAVFRHKRPAKRSILIDLDPTVLDQVVGGRPRPEVEVIVGDGLDFLRRFMPPENQRVLIYADPPYPRESRRDVGRDYYRHEWTKEKHNEFLQLVRHMSPHGLTVGFSAYILISSYWSDLYGKALRNWITDHFAVTTRGGPAEEWLWANYPRPQELHDYRFIGGAYPERWRIHKRQRSWVRMLRKMPPLERRAMLSRLIDEFGDEVLRDRPSTPRVVAAVSDGDGGAVPWR